MTSKLWTDYVARNKQAAPWTEKNSVNVSGEKTPQGTEIGSTLVCVVKDL